MGNALRRAVRSSAHVDNGTPTRSVPLCRTLCIVILAASTLGAPFARAAAQTPADRDTSNEVIEEVTVRGRGLQALRRELQAAREHVYEIYNALNDDDDFDIHCATELRTRSRFEERVCRARFVDEATSRAGREVLLAVQNLPGGLDNPMAGAILDGATSVVQREYAQLPQMSAQFREHMQRLSRESPELAAAIAQYRVKESQYRDATRKKPD